MKHPAERPSSTPSPRTLPDGWRFVKLREVIREAQAGFACGQRDADGVVQLRMNNLDTRGNFVWDDALRVPREGNNIEPFLLVPGDVLFNNTNSTELVGKSALFTGYAEPIVYSNHFTRLRTVGDALLPDVLASWLNHQWQKGVFASICNRWIGQSAVKADKLLSLDFPLPPLAEQQRIASILREQMVAVEKARAAAQARLEAVKALPAAYLREVFESEESRGWPKTTLGKVATLIQNGIYKSSEHYGHGHPFLRMYNVANDSWRLTLQPLARVNLDAADLEVFQLRVGDLLISRVNSFELVGKCGWVGPEAEGHVFENMLIRVRLADSIDSLFFAQQMRTRSVRRQIEAVTKRAIGQSSINSTDLRGIEIAVPPVVIQRNAAQSLSAKAAATEKARAAAEAELNTINALPAALLRRAFNGEI